jgi:hypothetical protein
MATTSPPDDPPLEPPIPIDDGLVYSVRWMGIRCGTMTLESYPDEEGEPDTYRIVLTARSSKFFDGIYKVRARLESWFDASRLSSVRYRDHSQEKNKTKDELYELDLDSGEVRRTKNGTQQSYEIEPHAVLDPLAYVYRIRSLAAKPGDRISLRLVTSKAALDTVALVEKKTTIKTKFGRRVVLRVQPRPESGMLFSKKGKMTLWIGTDAERIPYRISFDLYFGKLVAKLIAIGDEPEDEE